MGGPGSKCYDVKIFAPATKKAKIEVKEENEEMKTETEAEEKQFHPSRTVALHLMVVINLYLSVVNLVL